MKKVTKYQSEDGTFFDKTKDALKRDEVVLEVKRINALLGDIGLDDDCSFSNGNGYYQLTKTAIEQFDSQFADAVEKYIPDLTGIYKEKRQRPLPTYGYVGRYLSDTDSPLYTSYILRACIDSQFRRWGQPYFALNPGQAKQVRLGDL